jgi:hypothetical protein
MPVRLLISRELPDMNPTTTKTTPMMAISFNLSTHSPAFILPGGTFILRNHIYKPVLD